MPRHKRVKEAGLLRHVVSRGNGRMQIFCDDWDYRKFLCLLGETVNEFQLECWDWALMPTHFHLAVVNRLENLSEAMQHLKGDFATWWNRRHKHVGHVFEGPFKDQIVEEERYFLSLVRYIALNPVRAKLVERPEDWAWSHYRSLAGLCPPADYLSCEHVLRKFGDEAIPILRDRYVRYVQSMTPQEETRLEIFRSRERVLGSREFKRSIRRDVAPIVLEARRTSDLVMPGFI